MLELILSFLAGIITVLAPCILPLLPIVVGGSLSPNSDKKRPYIITASLLVSIVVFTFILKVSTSLIGIDPSVWSYMSGGIVIILGVVMLFPHKYKAVIAKLGLQTRSQKVLGRAVQNKNGTISSILTGLALGPVFTSCSPTYIWAIAVVLPKNNLLGALYLIVYCLGVAVSLLGVSLLGRRLTARLGWAVNPQGRFQRTLAILFIVVGIFVASGYDKKVQTWLVQKDYLNLIEIEQKLLP